MTEDFWRGGGGNKCFLSSRGFVINEAYIIKGMDKQNMVSAHYGTHRNNRHNELEVHIVNLGKLNVGYKSKNEISIINQNSCICKYYVFFQDTYQTSGCLPIGRKDMG